MNGANVGLCGERGMRAHGKSKGAKETRQNRHKSSMTKKFNTTAT